MSILRFRGKSRNPVGIGKPVFPTSTAGDGKLEADGFYKCKQCGFWNDSEAVESPGGTPEGDGGVIVDTSEDPPEPEVTSFCAFCGSPNSR